MIPAMSRPNRRSSRRERQERREKSTQVPRLPWRNITNPYPPIEVLSADQLEAIHHASQRVLSEIGMKVLGEDARNRLAAAGAEVDHEDRMVRCDPGMVDELMALAPSSFVVKARNPSKSVHIGGNHVNFGPVGGPSFVTDLDRGRRAGTFDEMCDFLRVLQSLDIIHLGGAGSFEPLDLPADSRHLDRSYAAATLHDKVWGANLLGGYRARDGLEMMCIVHGIGYEELPDHVVTMGNINTNSPRQLDGNMSAGLTELALAGQPVVVTPFTLLGAMAPTTIAGALTQQNAEALLGMVLCQVIRPGTPVVYGGFTSNVDMKSGAPAFGTPEYVKATQAGAQLARRYNVPFRSSSTNASNVVDAQAAYESEMSIWAAVMGHTNMVFHAGGWLEGGLTASFEKLIIDAEMLQMMAEYMVPLDVDDDTLAIDAIAEVEPGGHFFGASHTLERFESAFYEPIVSDWRNFETWEEDGALTATQRANGVWKQLLAEYEQPPLDEGIREALEEFVTRRKKEIADGPDLLDYDM
jgi:trimethylamine--corrinoid protein Co-methyltransferase